MAIVTSEEMAASFKLAGPIGFGRGYGDSRRGKVRYGGCTPEAGMYQRRMVGVGSTLAPKKKGGRLAISRGKFYGYNNSSIGGRIAWRATFAAGKAQYDLLTTDEKVKYSKEARTLCMSGYNLFMSRWLQSHRA